jgi:hypothetical protein
MSGNTDVSFSCWHRENDLTRCAQIAQQTGQQREEPRESTSEPAVSDFESEPDDESKHPEFRAHTTRKDEMKAERFKPLYKVGRNVYLQGSGRSLKGMSSKRLLSYSNDSLRPVLNFESQQRWNLPAE